jgi:hypothetical protein
MAWSQTHLHQETRSVKQERENSILCYQGGSAFHLIEASPVDDGHSAIQALKSWYGSTNTSRTIIEHYRMKLQELQLYERTTATTFINDFIICSQKLEKRNEGDTAESKRHKFLDKITDVDYDVVIQRLKGETALTFDQCVLRVQTREQELQSSANKATKAKSRRTKTGDEKEKEKSSSDQVDEIPGFIVYKIKQPNVRRDLIKMAIHLKQGGTSYHCQRMQWPEE